MRVRKTLLAAAVVVLAAGQARGLQPVPAGPALVVSHTGYNAYFSSDGYVTDARVATAADGDFVVVWTRAVDDAATENALGSAGYGIFGRRYDRTGTPLAPEFQVSALQANGYQMRPGVAATPAGSFVVVWGNPDAEDIRARRYDAGGAALGGEFQVAASDDYSRQTAVAVEPDGGFVAVWDQFVPGTGNDVFARRFDAAGVPEGAPFEVDTSTAGWQGYARVASDPSGNFVVVWNRSYDTDDGVLAQRFDQTGAPLGGEIPALARDDNEIGPAVATAADGSFVVVSDTGSGTSARRFDATGAPLGPEIAVGSGDASNSVVASDTAGNFLVVWEEYVGSHGQLLAQLFDAGGAPQGTSIQVSTSPIEDNPILDMPSVAAQADGDFVVAWAHNYSYKTRGVYVRRIGVCGNGRLTPGLPCDDGNTTPLDGCSPVCQLESCYTCAGEPSACGQIPDCDAVCTGGAAVDPKVVLTLNRLLAPTGDETVSFTGSIVSPPVAPGAYKPAVEGAEVMITGDGVIWGLAGPTAVPPGVIGSGCGPLDGWRVSGTSYTYKNFSNALPPGCAPGSARGLRTLKIKDLLARRGVIQFQVKVAQATLPPVPTAPLIGTIVLGQSPAAGAAGRCAQVTLAHWTRKPKTARYIP